MDKKITNTKMKLLKIFIICSIVFMMFNVYAIIISYLIAEQQDQIADQIALASIKSIAEFATLPKIIE